MFHSPHFRRRGITRVEFLVLVGIIGFLLCLLIPAIQAAREAARQASCIGTLKMVGVALHNHQGTHGFFPPSMLERPAGNRLTATSPVPGSDKTNGGGADFSWRVMLLPYMEEGNCYTKLDVANGFPYDGDPQRQAVMTIPTRSRFSSETGVMQLCPSFAGSIWSEAPEYPEESAAISNYVALGATHLASLYQTETEPVGGTQPWTGRTLHPNGILYPGSRTSTHDITDGSSHTFLVCETREQDYAAWIDGTTAAVVGLVGSPSFAPQKKVPGGTWFEPNRDARTTLNWGSDDPSEGKCYANATDHSGSQPWVHGPSSFHPGLVNHLLADGSVQSVQDDIDPGLYMWLITRAGAEPVTRFYTSEE